jgi:hypothetical protein
MFQISKKQRMNWFIACCFIVMAAIATLSLTGCAGDVTEEYEIGQSEQEYVAVFASNPSQTAKVSYGTCQNRKREKCRPDVACSGGAACIIPRSTSFTFCVSGDDGPDLPNARWKDELRSFLLGDGFSGLPEMRDPEWASGVSWTATEVACSSAQFEFRNGVVPCFETECGANLYHPETIPNYVLISDASMTTLTEKCWTPQGLVSCDYPGTYKRRTGLNSKTMVWIDIPDIVEIAKRSSFWDGHFGSLHFALEHTVRWAAMVAAMNVGALLPGSDYPEPATLSGEYNLMQTLFYLRLDGFGTFDMDNWLSTWEDCQWRQFQIGTNTEFWQAPTGCSIPF